MMLLVDSEKLEQKVQAQLCGRVANLKVLLVSGGIVLRGSAKHYHDKQLAEHLVTQQTQLKVIANDIEVPS
jgi:hypothetical protein